MNLLIVEDDPTFFALLSEQLDQVAGIEITRAASRQSALLAIGGVPFDLAVCDLRIPTTDGNLDTEVEHGEAVVAGIREQTPGTPVIILSAHGTIKSAVAIVGDAPRCDLCGDGVELPLVGYLMKGDQVEECVQSIGTLSSRLAATESIELRWGVEKPVVSGIAARPIRMYARWLEGQYVDVAAVSGGLSESAALRLIVKDRQGRLRGRAFAKLGRLDLLLDERRRYQRYVSTLLPAGLFAPLQHHVDYGAGRDGGNFYQLAEDTRSLVDLLSESDERAAGLVARLQASTQAWSEGTTNADVAISQLRLEIDGADIAHLDAFGEVDWRSLEALQVPTKRAVQHGDLHAGNVLVRSGDQPLLVDYANAGDLFSGYDPIALEMGILFHPAASRLRGTWPSPAQAAKWCDLDSFLVGCPIPLFIRACRRWALDAVPSNRTMVALGYVHAQRQLRYSDTDKAIVGAVIHAARDALS